MAERLGDRVKFNSPVRCIEWNEGGATLTVYPSSQEGPTIYKARYVIVALAPTLYSSLGLTSLSSYYVGSDLPPPSTSMRRLPTRPSGIESADGAANANGQHPEDQYVL